MKFLFSSMVLMYQNLGPLEWESFQQSHLSILRWPRKVFSPWERRRWWPQEENHELRERWRRWRLQVGSSQALRWWTQNEQKMRSLKSREVGRPQFLFWTTFSLLLKWRKWVDPHVLFSPNKSFTASIHLWAFLRPEPSGGPSTCR